MTRFRLSTVERLREQQEQICARRLRECTQDLAQTAATRDQLIAQLTATGRARTPGGHLAMASMYRDRLREEIVTADQEIDRRTGVLEEARAAWTAARAQLRAVQTLHDRHREEQRAQARRREQAELDEFAGSRGHPGRAVLGGAG